MRLQGVVGTPVTPFGESGELDKATLEREVEFLVGTGIDALALPMHIGESLNLSTPERKELAEIAVSTVARRIPVLVNVSLSGTDQAVELARHAEGTGADGVVVLAPYHWQPEPPALIDHIVTVGRSVDIGILGYNYPARLGVEISADVVKALIDRLPNFVGLKDASFDMEYFTEVCRVSSSERPGFSVFTGVEYVLPATVLGGAGCFSAVGAVAPKLVRDLYDACAAGDFERARELQYEFSHLYTVLQVGYPATIKAAMEIMGRPVGTTRKPLPALTEQTMQALRDFMADFGALEQEPRGWEIASAAPAG